MPSELDALYERFEAGRIARREFHMQNERKKLAHDYVVAYIGSGRISYESFKEVSVDIVNSAFVLADEFIKRNNDDKRNDQRSC